MPDLLVTLLPLATLILGYVGTIATEGLRERWGRKREEENRRRIRQEEKRDRLEAFELINLREAHAALNHFARNTVRWHLLDIEAASKANVDYASDVIEDEEGVAEEVRVSDRDVSALTQLIIDDNLRSETEAAIVSMRTVGHGPKSINQAKSEVEAGINKVFAAQQKIAQRIREIYVDESIATSDQGN